MNSEIESIIHEVAGTFLSRKQEIIDALQYGIDHFDMDRLSAIRNNKLTL